MDGNNRREKPAYRVPFCSVLLSRKQDDRFSENVMGGTCNTPGNEEKRSVLDGKPEGVVCLGDIIVDGCC